MEIKATVFRRLFCSEYPVNTRKFLKNQKNLSFEASFFKKNHHKQVQRYCKIESPLAWNDLVINKSEAIDSSSPGTAGPKLSTTVLTAVKIVEASAKPAPLADAIEIVELTSGSFLVNVLAYGFAF